MMQVLHAKSTQSIRFPGSGSWFEEGSRRLGIKKVLSKVGLARGGADECAYIEREVDCERPERRKEAPSATSLWACEQNVELN